MARLLSLESTQTGWGYNRRKRRRQRRQPLVPLGSDLKLLAEFHTTLAAETKWAQGSRPRARRHDTRSAGLVL